MTHIAIQKALDGRNVDWMEEVSDEEYLVGPPDLPGRPWHTDAFDMKEHRP